MPSILDPLIDRFRKIPSAHWEAIAEAAGCAKSLPRKLVSRDRDNPTVGTVQPLFDYFDAVDKGERALPPQVLLALNTAAERKQEA